MEIIFKEMIKPSTPTPSNLKNYSLSFLDQLAPSHYFPLIFCYQPNPNYNLDHAQISQKLKTSLPSALTKFYPLAGRNNGSLSIDCNDAGASYYEAKVHAQLSEVMKHGKMEDLNQYLPLDPHGGWNDIDEKTLLAIQINFFDCGGIAVGVCMSHKIADGSSLVMFMSSWAAISCGDAESVLQPNFELASHYFPPKNLSFLGTKTHDSSIRKEKFVAKRLVFDQERLAKLKKVISSALDSEVKKASTRVEAVTAFLWKRFMDVGRAKMGSKSTFAALHALNLRPRMSPPLPEHTFGNLWRFVLALSSSSSDQSTKQYHDLVIKLRDGITKVNDDCINYTAKEDSNLDHMNKLLKLFSKGETEVCTFSSWCRFPVYEVDFGWGKPVWVSTTAIPFKNAVILMSTRNGDGIEALINMLEDEFEMLQNDEEFTSLIVHA